MSALYNPPGFDELTDTAIKIREVAEMATATCAEVRPGERVLVVTDTGSDSRMVELVAASARRLGAEVLVIQFGQVDSVPKIPQRVLDEIENTDLMITLARTSVLYTGAVAKLQKQGGRILYMGNVPTELFLSPVVHDIDLDELQHLASAFAELCKVDAPMRVTSRLGTDATMTLRSDSPISISKCTARRDGERDYLPGGAWYACPVESSVNGVFVLDCSLHPVGHLSEPVALTYKDGLIVGIEGGAQASEFKDWIDGRDQEIRGFSHNGGGFNPYAVPSATGRLMNDERIMGSFCVAGGSNTLGWPGSNHSSYHFDGMVLAASYSVGGVPLCEEGVLVHPQLTSKTPKE